MNSCASPLNSNLNSRTTTPHLTAQNAPNVNMPNGADLLSSPGGMITAPSSLHSQFPPTILEGHDEEEDTATAT